jgi:hypothetical protein
MNKQLAEIVRHPMTYVLGCALCGATSVTAGMAVIAGPGWGMVTAGAFLLAASWYITQGLKPNG